MKKDGFWGTDNLHRAGWAALIGLAGFLGALAYQKLFGPQKVVIDTSAIKSKPIIFSKEPSSSDPSSEDVAILVEALRRIRQTNDPANESTKFTALEKSVRELQEKLAKTELTQARPPADHQVGKLPKFKLPKSVKGYSSATLDGTANITCPKENFKGQVELLASFTLNDESLLTTASPLSISLVRQKAPSEFEQVSEFTQPLRLNTNSIRIKPALTPGKYQLIFGYYLRDRIDGEYPNFYSKVCAFQVQP